MAALSDVVDGLAAGETVIASPNALLQPGMRVVVGKVKPKRS